MKNSLFLILCALLPSKTKTTTENKENICTIFSAITISTASGDCSVSMAALIENNRIKEPYFEVDAESESIRNECLSSALFLKNKVEEKTTQSVLNFTEQSLLENRQSSGPLDDHDEELHKVIALRALKNGLINYLRQAN